MTRCLRRCSRPGSVSLLPREFASEKTFTSRRANSQPARYRYLRLRVSCVPASLERVTFTLVASVRVAIRIATTTRQHKYSRVIVDVYIVIIIILRNFLVTTRQRCLSVQVPFLNVISGHGQVIDAWI